MLFFLFFFLANACYILCGKQIMQFGDTYLKKKCDFAVYRLTICLCFPEVIKLKCRLMFGLIISLMCESAIQVNGSTDSHGNNYSPLLRKKGNALQ